MSEIKNGRLALYGAEHSKCNHMMTLGFKELTFVVLIRQHFVSPKQFCKFRW